MTLDNGIEVTYRRTGGVYLNSDIPEGHIRYEWYISEQEYKDGKQSAYTENIDITKEQADAILGVLNG